MLITIAVVLLILWALGLVTSYTVGGFIHLLLLVAIILVLIRLSTSLREVAGPVLVDHQQVLGKKLPILV